MAALERQIDAKQHVINGKMTQAKGVVREQWGNLQNDELTRLAGKKDQVVGKLQSTYGNSWLVRNSGWVLLGTAVATVAAAFIYIFTRGSQESSQDF